MMKGGEKQGHLGNLDEMSLPKLKELLARQEMLLKKEKFLLTLQDKGRKIKEFAQVLRGFISERESIETLTDSFPGIRLTTLDIPPHRTKCEAKPRIKSEFEKLRDKSGADISISSDISASSGGDAAATLSKNDSVQDDQVQDSSDKDSLVTCFENISLSTDRVAKVEEKYVNSYERVMKRSVLREKKHIFRPNKTLNISAIEDLPDTFIHPSKHESGRSTCVTPSTDVEDISDVHKSTPTHRPTIPQESAVIIPKLKYDACIMLSIEESIQLVTDQRKRVEDIQAKQAAEKLAARMHIQLESFNPEGSTLKYREQPRCDTDSDDEPEVEGYVDD